METNEQLLIRIKNLQSLAIDLLSSKVMVLEKYAEPFNQKLHLSLDGLEGLKDVFENVVNQKILYKDTETFENHPYIIFRQFEFEIWV